MHSAFQDSYRNAPSGNSVTQLDDTVSNRDVVKLCETTCCFRLISKSNLFDSNGYVLLCHGCSQCRDRELSVERSVYPIFGRAMIPRGISRGLWKARTKATNSVGALRGNYVSNGEESQNDWKNQYFMGDFGPRVEFVRCLDAVQWGWTNRYRRIFHEG